VTSIRDWWTGRRSRDARAGEARATVPTDHLLDGRVALVTGGSGILGSAICGALASEGARVAVAYFRRADQAAAIVARIERAGGTAFAWRADVRDRAEVDALVRAVGERYGDVEILVNNAATVPPEIGMKSFLAHTWEDYQAYLDTVVKGAVHCCQAVLPGMVRRGRGRIITIGTTALHEINAHLNPYVTAKGALVGLTRSLAEEFGRHHITVNGVAPGWVWSGEREPGPQDGRIFRDRSPLGDGLVRPRHVADAVVFLASDRAAMITGAYLPVAAGQVPLG
jgi:3-oxoacyl-[acyl-carrier protein] reductase